MINLDECKIIKKLGQGMAGTTYLVSYKNKKYALKIEKIPKKNLKPNLSTRDWRDIEFSKNFANKYPEQFIYLYEYDIINNCEHIQEYEQGKIPDYLPKYVQKYLQEKIESTFCVRKLYTLVDNNFSNISETLTKNQYYSFIGQMAFIFLLLKKGGYTHNDLHGQNIGISDVNKNKKLDILSYKFPTLGIQYRAIDFGMVLNDKYKMNKEEIIMNKLNKKEEFIRIIKKLVSFDKIKLITYDKYPSLFSDIKKHFLFECTKVYLTNLEDRFLLFQILFPEEFQKVYLKNKFAKTEYPKIKIDLIDFIYILKNQDNFKKIIKLCYEKIK